MVIYKDMFGNIPLKQARHLYLPECTNVIWYFQHYWYFYHGKIPVYFCPFQMVPLASNALLLFPMSNKSYNNPVTVVSKNLTERVQHQLYKWEIHFPTSKGLYEGDMTRIKPWFDIEIAQWKVRMLWLGWWRAMYFCFTLQWPRFNSQLMRGLQL